MERITIIVTRPKGSWRWQDAYALSTYERKDDLAPWRFVERSDKFAKTRSTAGIWENYKQGLSALPKRRRAE